MLLNEEVIISKIVQETHDTKTFYVDTSHLDISFTPGQFYMLSTLINGKEVRRAYSIATSPTEKGILGFTIKITPEGQFSTYSFNHFKEGSTMNISGPYGKFLYQGQTQPLVLIGAGSGIAPLRSITKYVLDKKLNIPIKLLFSNKTEQDIIFKKEFDTWAQQHKNFVPYYTLTGQSTWNGPKGRITKEVLEQECFFENALYYLCGPPDFVRALETGLKELGIVEQHIHTEKYN